MIHFTFKISSPAINDLAPSANLSQAIEKLNTLIPKIETAEDLDVALSVGVGSKKGLSKTIKYGTKAKNFILPDEVSKRIHSTIDKILEEENIRSKYTDSKEYKKLMALSAEASEKLKKLMNS